MRREQRQERRRTRRRRRRAGSYPLQLAGAATLVALTGWLVVVVLIKAAHPYWLSYDVERKVARLRAELAQRKARNAALRAQISYLQSEEGMEALARRSGWRRPGETVYYLRETPAGESGAPGESARDGR